MASSSTFLHSLSHPNSFSPCQTPQKSHQHFSIKCTNADSNNNKPSLPPQIQPPDTNNASASATFPTVTPTTLNPPETFPLEKRRNSTISRPKTPRPSLTKPEPPNFEVGWKRTKPINLEKPVGYVIMDFLEKLEGLMEREFGSTTLLAKAGEIVAERVREEAEVLREEGKVEERMVTELFRVLKLMEMDLEMVKAAVKQETLDQRIEQAKARCRQAILVANAF